MKKVTIIVIWSLYLIWNIPFMLINGFIAVWYYDSAIWDDYISSLLETLDPLVNKDIHR